MLTRILDYGISVLLLNGFKRTLQHSGAIRGRLSLPANRLVALLWTGGRMPTEGIPLSTALCRLLEMPSASP